MKRSVYLSRKVHQCFCAHTKDQEEKNKSKRLSRNLRNVQSITVILLSCRLCIDDNSSSSANTSEYITKGYNKGVISLRSR